MGLQIHPSMRREIVDELAEAFGADVAPTIFRQFEANLPFLIRKGMRAQQEVSILNHNAKHRGVEGIGQCFVRWAPDFKYVVALLFGAELAADDRFLAEIERDNCSIKFKPTYDPLPRIVVSRPLSPLQTVPREPHKLETVPKGQPASAAA